MCCSVTGGGGGKRSKTAPVDDFMQLLRTEGSPYREKFRLKAKNTHASVVTACEERFATQMTAQTTALRDQLMPFTLQIQAKTASNLTTCVIVQGAHASQLPNPKRQARRLYGGSQWGGK